MTQSKNERPAILNKFEINLSQSPRTLDIPNQNEERIHFAVGDAHGNWFKIIHNAFSFGTVTSSNLQFMEEMRALYDFLTQEFLNKEQFNHYLNLLNTCSVKPGIKDIFLGDTRCDRGQNDILTLAWFAHLDAKKSTFKIIFSNHDLDGLQPKTDFIRSFNRMNDYNKTFYVSRFNMEHFLDSNQDDLEIKQLYQRYEQVYKKHLLLIDYTVTEENHILVYTHAGCGMETIQALAEKYHVAYNESSIQELIGTINKINIQFKKHLEQDFDWEVLCDNDPEYPHRIDPLFNVIMTRELSAYFRDQPQNNSYRVYHVHGHNGEYPYIRNIPVYLAAIPLSQPLPMNVEQAIMAKEAIFIVTNPEDESPNFYIFGLDRNNRIKRADFLSDSLLNSSLKVLHHESKDQLEALGLHLKQKANAESFERIDLKYLYERVPFTKNYLKNISIAHYYVPSSLMSLDGNLGKIHSYMNEEVLITHFEQTHSMKMLSSTPYPKYHPDKSIKEKRAASPSFFREASDENIDPNSPERSNKRITPP